MRLLDEVEERIVPVAPIDNAPAAPVTVLIWPSASLMYGRA